MDEGTFVGVGSGSDTISTSSGDAPGHGVVTERVQALANSVYREFAQVVSQYGEGPVASLMPIVITVLESLDGALSDLGDSQRALEEATDDNEQLHAQYEKEKQLRRDEQAKRMRNEDQGEDERRELRQQLEQVGSYNRQLKNQLKTSKDRAERSEEKNDKLKTDLNDLQLKYRRMNHAFQQQVSMSNIRPRTGSGARTYPLRTESPMAMLSEPAQVLESASMEVATRTVGVASSSPLVVGPSSTDLSSAVRHQPIASELAGFRPPVASSPLPAETTVKQIQDMDSAVLQRLDLESPLSPVPPDPDTQALPVETAEDTDIMPRKEEEEEVPSEAAASEDEMSRADQEDEDLLASSRTQPEEETANAAGESLEMELQLAGKDTDESASAEALSVEPAEDESSSTTSQIDEQPQPQPEEAEEDQVSAQQPAEEPTQATVEAPERAESPEIAEAVSISPQARPESLRVVSTGQDEDVEQQSPESFMLDIGGGVGLEEVERLTEEKRELEKALDMRDQETAELKRQLESLADEKQMLEGRIETAQHERSEMQTRYRAMESDLQERSDRLEEMERRAREDEEPLFPGANDNEAWAVSQKRQYTRIEMARLLRERNEFKERFLSLKEKLQILQQRQEVPTPKKKEKSLWKVFSDMFKTKPSRSPSIPRRTSKTTSSKAEEPIDSAVAQSKSVSTPPPALTFEDGRRFEAYGWSLPEAMAPRSLTTGKATPPRGLKRSEINRLDTVPVLMHCGHLSTEPLQDQFAFGAARTWCAAAVCSTEQSNPSLHPSDTICPSSLIWVCTGTSELSRVNVVDANMPGEVIDSFPVCSSPILCIASVPGVEDDENMIHIASATDDSSTLTPTELDQYRYRSPTQSPPLQITADHFTKSGATARSPTQDSPPEKVISLQEAFADSPTPGRAHSGSIKGELIARPRLRLPTMWMGAEFGCLYIHSAVSLWRSCLHAMKVEASVLSIVYAQQKVFVAMANSSLAIFKRERDEWNWEDYKVTYLGADRDVPISVMVAVKHRVWCGVGNKVYVVDANTCKVETHFKVHPSVRSRVLSLVASGDGVWVSVRLDSTLRLFHADTFQNLQDVDVAKPIQTLLTFPGSKRKPSPRNLVRISTLLISNNCMWVGASNGTIISLPLTEKRPVEGHETPQGANASFSSFSILGEDVTNSSDGSMALAMADASGTGLAPTVPYISLDASRLSFHGHVHNVDVLVATPGVMATRTVKVMTDGTSTPKRISSAAVTFVTSVGGGYVDFRSDASTPASIASSSNAQAHDRNHIIVWQVSPNNID